MTKFIDTVEDQYGNPVSGVEITVYRSNGALATLTTDAGTALLNPVFTDDLGAFSFNVTINDAYTLQYRVSALAQIFRTRKVAISADTDLVSEDLQGDNNIGAVADALDEIGAVAAIASSVVATGGVASDIPAVAGVAGDIPAVADAAADIAALAPHTDALESAADNIPAIIAAPTYAATVTAAVADFSNRETLAWDPLTAAAGTANTSSDTRISGATFGDGGLTEATGLLDSLTIWSQGAVTNARVKLVSRSGTTFTLQNEKTVTLAAGANVVAYSPPLEVQQGWAPAIKATGSGNLGYALRTGLASGTSYTVTGDLATSGTGAASTSGLMISASIRHKNLAEQVDETAAETTDRFDVLEAKLREPFVAGVATPVSASGGSDSNTRFEGTPIGRRTLVKQIQLYIQTLGGATGNIIFATVDTVALTAVHKMTLAKTFSSTGLKTLTAPADFTEFWAEADWHYGYKANSSGALQAILTGQPTGTSYNFSGQLTTSGAVTAAASLLEMNISGEAEITPVGEADLDTLAAEVDAVRGDFPRAVGETLRGRTLINETSFPGTGTPTGWALAGATVNASLHSPSSSNVLTNYARFDSYSGANRRSVEARAVIADTAAIFGIAFWPMEPGTNSFGTYCEVNGPAAEIRIYSFNGTTTVTQGYAAAIPFALVPGRPYKLIAKRKAFLKTFTLVDLLTGQNVTVSSDETATATGGRMWGKPGIIFRTTAVDAVVVSSFKSFTHVATGGIVMYGDSNHEGSVAPAYPWSNLLDSLRDKGDILNASRGGEESTNSLLRIASDITALAPSKLIIGLGTNDSSLATWRTNIQTAITAALAANAACEIIFCTLVPDGAALTTQINADIRANYFALAKNNYIENNYALSTGHLGAAWNSTYQADSLHANQAGQIRMTWQAAVDRPDLLPYPSADVQATLTARGLTLVLQ